MENSSNTQISFSKSVKEELLTDQGAMPRHCRIAEIAAITAFCGVLGPDENNEYRLKTDNPQLAKKYFTLLCNTIKISECANSLKEDEFAKLCELLKAKNIDSASFISDVLFQRECCKSSFLRGAFLAGGTISNPNKSYHMEFISDDGELIDKVSLILESIGVCAKTTKRKSHHVAYIKDGTRMVELLGVIGAPLSLMEFENVRIRKGVNNDLNRKINFEVANIKKTVDAALSQIEDIAYIEAKVGLSELPESLREVAQMRKMYPEATLTELGLKLTPPVGKSGINHRLRRVSQFAEKLRKEVKQ